jgi:hypothetical protein
MSSPEKEGLAEAVEAGAEVLAREQFVGIPWADLGDETKDQLRGDLEAALQAALSTGELVERERLLEIARKCEAAGHKTRTPESARLLFAEAAAIVEAVEVATQSKEGQDG